MRILNFFLASALAQDERKEVPKGMTRSETRGRYPSAQSVGWDLYDKGQCQTTSLGRNHWQVESRHDYTNHEDCRLNFKCDSNQLAFVKWNRMHIESHSRCYYDYVKLSWKQVNPARVVSEYHCGEKNENTDAELFDWRETNAQHLVVDFYSDYSIRYWGFDLEIKCIDSADIDVCDFTECHENASCSVDESTNTAVCTCNEAYVGDGVNECIFEKFKVNTYRVTSSISDRYVQNEVAVVVQNQHSTEGYYYTFDVNLDEYEFISSLVMRVGDNGPVTKGSVHLEQTAQEIFDNAVAGGGSAAITSDTTEDVEDPVSDSSFSTTVYVPGGEKLYVWLNYDMQILRTYRNYKYRTHIRPTDRIEMFELIVDINESRPLKMGQTYVWFESEDKHSSNTFRRRILDNGHVQFTYVQEGVPRESFDNQLRVEYDLDRPSQDCGDIILRDGYFVHFISPEGVAPMPKNVVITIDTSGSMSVQGRMRKAREAVKEFLDQLGPEDTFWLQEFNSYTTAYKSETQAATPGNIALAKEWVSNLNAGGGTALSEATLNSINRDLDDQRANIAFIISDGEPTSGETNWAVIQANALAANERDDGLGQKWAVFNIGIGSNAPYNEISKLSTQNMGVGIQIFDNEAVTDVLTGFFSEYATPLIWNQKFQYSGVSQFDCSSTNLYANQEMVCVGRLEEDCSPNQLVNPGEGMLVSDQIASIFGGGTARGIASRCKVLDRDQCRSGSNVAVAGSGLLDNPFPLPEKVDLRKLYSYQFMQRRLKLYHATRNTALREQIQDEIEELAVQDQFVTIFTSLVVVEGQVRKKRGIEKRQEIAALFEEHNALVAQDNETVRVRRDAPESSTRLNLGLFALLAVVMAVLPMRRFRRRLC